MSTESELVAPLNHRLCCLMRGGEDEDNIGRLSELIALAEAGLQAEEAEDDTGRLSELILLVTYYSREDTRVTLTPMR